MPCGIWDPSSPTRDQTRLPYGGKHGVLTTGPPGKSEQELLLIGLAVCARGLTCLRCHQIQVCSEFKKSWTLRGISSWSPHSLVATITRSRGGLTYMDVARLQAEGGDWASGQTRLPTFRKGWFLCTLVPPHPFWWLMWNHMQVKAIGYHVLEVPSNEKWASW